MLNDLIDEGAGQEIVTAAQEIGADYTRRGVKYKLGGDASTGGRFSDCSHYVNHVLNQSGFALDYVTTSGIGNSPDYELVSPDDSFPGMILVQGGHMGIFTGFDSNDMARGWQMGNHGVLNAKWGVGGWFDKAQDLRFYSPIA